MKDRVFTLKEVAEILKVSERTIFRYIHGGKLKATKIGNWRIREEDLDEFLSPDTNKRTKNKK